MEKLNINVKDLSGNIIDTVEIADEIDAMSNIAFKAGELYLFDNNYRDGRYDIVKFNGWCDDAPIWETIYESVFVEDVK